MYSEAARQRALAALERCGTLSAASRATGVSRATLRGWRDHPERSARRTCPRCHGCALPTPEYAALHGFYRGDGHVSRMARYFALRISCDAAYPAIVEDVAALVGVVHPTRPVFRVPAPGCVVVQSHWQHWPCLFPQHGPGRKHERPIVLEPWQRSVVEQQPGAFLRGLLHSDGCRANNWTRKRIAGEWKRYDYPRWQFTNRSADIRELLCWALDLVEVPWRQSGRYVISVSTRAGVARLDERVGPKS